MLHSQGPSDNPYHEPNQSNSLYLHHFLISVLTLSSHLRLGLPTGLLAINLPDKILKSLILSSILAIWPAHLNLIDLSTLTILDKRYKLLQNCETFSTLHSLPFWTQIFVSGFCFQMPF